MITIIDSGVGNIGSIQNIIKKIGEKSKVTIRPEDILIADRLILPGVGSFDHAINWLHNYGLFQAINEIAKKGKPILGICLGMQLLADFSEEGVLPGLGLISGKVIKFDKQSGIKIPHMGWNNICYDKTNKLFCGFDDFEETKFYFVHSFYFDCEDKNNIISQTNYGLDFASAINKDNIFGVQFHPEKSHRFGIKLFNNFLKI